MVRFNPLPPLALTDLQPCFYDVESVSTVEMVSKLYAYLQSLVNDYNAFVNEINANITDFENSTDKNIACFKKCVMDLMTNYIESIDTKINLQNSNIAQAIDTQNRTIQNSIDAQNQAIQNAIDYMKNNLINTVNNLFRDSLSNGDIRATLGSTYDEPTETLLLFIEGSEVNNG